MTLLFGHWQVMKHRDNTAGAGLQATWADSGGLSRTCNFTSNVGIWPSQVGPRSSLSESRRRTVTPRFVGGERQSFTRMCPRIMACPGVASHWRQASGSVNLDCPPAGRASMLARTRHGPFGPDSERSSD